MTRRFMIALVIGFAFVISVSAQSSKPNETKPAERSRADDDARRLKEARIAFAIQTVSWLADEARSYKDESLRVKIQARVADLLWNVDRERAKTLFDRAWDAAQTADTDGRRKAQEARQRYLSGQGGNGFIPPPPNLRAEVLRLASLHDRALAERFLAKMDEENKREEEEQKNKPWDPTQPSEAVAKRLQLARQLLETGENEKALAVAGPGLGRVSSDGIIFLVLLRQTNPSLADQLFLSMLRGAVSDFSADATAVSVLASYVFTPSVFVTSTRNGLLMNPWHAPLPPPKLGPALVAEFFRATGQILLRPLNPAELELTSAGVAGTYFTIQRLMPLFQQNAPDVVTLLQSRLNALSNGQKGILPGRQRDFINAGFDRKETKEETVEDVLARIEKAASTPERNQLFALAARDAAMKNDFKARDFATKIEDEELRKRVRNFVDFVLIAKALENRESEKALQLLRNAELKNVERAWSYSELASLFKNSTQERASEMLSQATTEAARIDGNSLESAEAQVAIATRTNEIDPARQWDAALDVVKATNRTELYTGEENTISVDFQSREGSARFSVAAPSINIATLFDRLAKEDPNQATDIAMTIKSESPRAVAILASARSVFETIPKNQNGSKSKP